MTALSSTLEARLNDLCAAIVSDADLVSARSQAESFLADDSAVSLYREVMTVGRELQRRESQGEDIDESDVSRFEELQTQADANPLIRGFADAQERLQSVLQVVNGFVAKTLERGAIPSHADVFGNGGCGEGCGCH